jgi:uncharacterized protein YecE (DUF72 family)
VLPAPVSPRHVELAARLPTGVYLGTSSWSTPAWVGIVWAKEHSEGLLSREGLAAYAEHPLLCAAGIDRTYYQPLPAEELRAYAEQVPAGFRFVVKAHEALTVATYPDHERYGARRGKKNGFFLDAAYAAEAVVGPVMEGLGEKAGPLVFQFAPQDLGEPLPFIERLFKFLDGLPRGPGYAVEVRNRDVLRPQYALALVDAGVAPCFTVHPRMPSLAVQWRWVGEVGLAPGAPLLVRWMLPPGKGYEETARRYAPFDRLVEEDRGTREEVACLVLGAIDQGRRAFVTINNKAEGSAPLSVFRLAERLAR